LSADIKSLVEKDPACERLMTVPGIGLVAMHRQRDFLSSIIFAAAVTTLAWGK